MRTRHVTSAIIGSLLLATTLTELVNATYGFYEEYYLFPEQKYGVLDPLRWQDIVFLIGFYFVSAALLYLSFRLLRRALRNKPPKAACPLIVGKSPPQEPKA